MPAHCYLDYAASTPVDPAVARAMAEVLSNTALAGNPSNQGHAPGRQASALIATARRQVADLLGVEPASLVFTSGATEANNLALKGAVRFYRDRAKRALVSATSHESILRAADRLAREGFRVDTLPVAADGQLRLEALAEALERPASLVSVEHVNNETGVVQDIASIARICHDAGALLHVDAAQSLGRTAIDLHATAIDLASLSGHKVYGPKGVGVLYLRRRPRVQIAPLLHGGGQEQGLRPGTLPTHQIVGMGVAAAQAGKLWDSDQALLRRLNARLGEGVARLPGIHRNGNPEICVPGIVNLSLPGVHRQALDELIDALAASGGAACSTATLSPSHVLAAMGQDHQRARCALRLSFGRFTTEGEIDRALALLGDLVTHCNDNA